jgi:phosphate transport system permease protein
MTTIPSELGVEPLSGRDAILGRAIAPRRRLADRAFWLLCLLGMGLVITPVLWILIGVAVKAIPHFAWSALTEASTGVGGGLGNAIAGTFVIMLGVAIVASVIGIGSGVYLAEIAPPTRRTTILRSAAEVLAGIPSIVFGYCGYLALVIGLHWKFSLLPAVIVLSLLVVPYIAKSTELALNQVPVAYREGGEALGMTKTHLLRRVVVRTAIPGIATGVIVALAISVGETAPLIYTAGYTNAFPSAALVHQPIGYLTYASYAFYDSPIPKVQYLAYDASLLLVILVTLLIFASRLVVRSTQKYAPNRAMGGR